MRAFRYLLFLSIIVVLAGCTGSSLKMPDQLTIVIETDKNKVRIDGTVHTKRRVNLNNRAFVYQSVFGIDKREYIVYETVELDANYRYNYGAQRTMSIVFDSKKVNTIYMFQHLTFLQIELQDRENLNVLVDLSHEKYLRFAYGFTSRKFKKIIETVDASRTMPGKALREEVMVLRDPQKAILSQWNTNMLLLDNIIVPISRRMQF